MNRTCIGGFLLVFLVCLLAPLSIQAWEGDQSQPYLLTDQELDALLEPIALYPDPLLAQMLPASTYPSEIAEAAAWLQRGGDPSRIDEQNWDESVKAVAHYPNVLYMMAERLDWTASLGDAFINQPEDVTKSIQWLRWQAKAVGNLESTNEQTVVTDGDYIEIIPAQPQYIYVPQYDPLVVYVERPAPGISPFIAFGLGLAIGSWLNMDLDWGHHHVVYHGWNRPGWVNHARPYVHIPNVYSNRSRPYINQTWRHDVNHGGPDRYWASRPGGSDSGRYARTPEIRGRAATPAKPSGGVFGPSRDAQTFSNRGKESLDAARPRPATPTQGISQRPSSHSIQQPPATTPGFSQRPTAPTPDRGQRRTTPAPGMSSGSSQPSPARGSGQPARTPSSVFGGYRGADEARTQSLRGQTNRQSSVGVPPSPAPASRGGSPPAGKAAAGDRKGSPR